MNPNRTILDPIAAPDWMPSARAVIVLALVQANRPLDIIELLRECRAHVPHYAPGQCSAAILSLEQDGSIYHAGGAYHLAPDPMDI